MFLYLLLSSVFFFERWQKYFLKISSKVCRYKLSTYICREQKQKIL